MTQNKAISVREDQVMTAFELDAVKAQLSALLEANPKKIESFRTKILTMSLTYGLKDCTPESIINCGLQALTLDMPLQNGRGYIVNYGGQAQFDIGYLGWKLLAKRAGYEVESDCVFTCDHFDMSGLGFNREIIFKPDHTAQKPSDDKWVRQNLAGVVVSIRESETGNTSVEFVDAEMIWKITAISPSQKTDKGKAFSPHEKWRYQMVKAKAIKHVLSKSAIDFNTGDKSMLHDAIGVVNQTESAAQQQQVENASYPDEKFTKVFPEWEKRVAAGKSTAAQIISQVTAAYKFSPEQLEKIIGLREIEPTDAEYVEVKEPDTAPAATEESKAQGAEFFKAADQKAAAGE